MHQTPDTVILYHGNCNDGWCAAWIAGKSHPDAVRVPVEYGKPIPVPLKGKRVFVLDFSYTMEEMRAWDAALVRVLDHHRTAAERWGFDPSEDTTSVDGSISIQYSATLSGAVMAAKYFGHPEGCLIPAYVQDRDLWQCKLPYTKAVNAYLAAIPHTDEAWDDVAGSSVDAAVIAGQAILAREGKIVERAVKNAFAPKGNKYVLCNSGCMQSEIGNVLATRYPFRIAVVWHMGSRGDVKLSLRSVGDVDCTVLAKKNGGGGHKNAAGSTMTTGVFMKFKI